MVLPRPSQILNSIVALPDCPAASAANALPITSSIVLCTSAFPLASPMTWISSSALTGLSAKRIKTPRSVSLSFLPPSLPSSPVLSNAYQYPVGFLAP
ncbi:hypothetical protein PtA15_5A480 [Puccinia triticina]|uniref:Ig-like domain-containing protein n=1 Tax=Puccinia triticina TaxID=208348 RepID=A0ABY7CKA0_9BASI|nr:uncharacterized protein PtA15_5A480 [Puccinia triticina]WAQ84907.1 hypothetical protein PtA15_5A480 [Puccinia triticina]